MQGDIMSQPREKIPPAGGDAGGGKQKAVLVFLLYQPMNKGMVPSRNRMMVQAVSTAVVQTGT